jgi:high-affinity Fe2+/Pb2+ permease
MAAKNGTANTIIYLLMVIVVCLILGGLFFSFISKPLSAVYMDSSYYPIVTCFHDHRI